MSLICRKVEILITLMNELVIPICEKELRQKSESQKCAYQGAMTAPLPASGAGGMMG